MSTPAAVEGWLSSLSHALLVMFIAGFAGLVTLAAAAVVIAAIDWEPIVERLSALALMVAAMYWASTYLPGPVKKVGRMAGQRVVRAVKSAADKRASRR